MMNNHFADIILPIAAKGCFTYSIPDVLVSAIAPGSRVLVQFGNRKLYSGIVNRIHDKIPSYKNIRAIIRPLDKIPLVNETQLKFWSWISAYYMCSIGEVMKAALPSDFFLEGVAEVPVVEKYRPREEPWISLAQEFSEKELNQLLDKLGKAPRQQSLLTFYLGLSGYEQGKPCLPVQKKLLLKASASNQGILDQLVARKILSVTYLEKSRLIVSPQLAEPVKQLSEVQEKALGEIKEKFREKEIVLLHGVTSSGKTEIFIHLIEEQIRKGKQVLYLLPEIALTTQIIQRLDRHFSSVSAVYHSRFTNAEKVEIWNRVSGNDPENKASLVIGVRSALYLPFSDLGLVIIDEEQDSSYKQHDPAPRYHARDSAIILAGLHKARTILGSASPSIESYYNAMSGKYGLVELTERFNNVKLPEIIVANSREAYRKRLMVSHFTPELLETIDDALGRGEQVILFQNRRGFSPYIECRECGWIPKCIQCAVSLTYHKGINRLVCHYCGFTSPVPSACDNCHSHDVATRGFGTEKIEDEIKIVFPAARVSRMDQDTTRGKNSFDKLIRALEEKRTDILIGTQMISKGLDIENLTVVGVLNADNLLNFPDFRAHERSFHMMEQVSGRAGRRNKPGRVVIQTADPDNRIIRLVLRHDFKNMYRIQAEERKAFNYPPFCRLIRINLRHKDRAALNTFAEFLGRELRTRFGNRVLGPEFPLISQVQSWYIKTILLKLEKEKPVAPGKNMIAEAVELVEQKEGASGLRIAIDVDPY